MLIMILCFLLLTGGCLTAFALAGKAIPVSEPRLLPFAVLPVPDGMPDTKAFLEFYASQIAWMDSDILTTVVLLYPEQDSSAKQLCTEISRQYDFFTVASLSEAQQLLAYRLKKEIF